MCGRITITTGTIVTTARSVWRPRARPLMPTAYTSTATRCTTAVVATAAIAAESPPSPLYLPVRPVKIDRSGFSFGII